MPKEWAKESRRDWEAEQATIAKQDPEEAEKIATQTEPLMAIIPLVAKDLPHRKYSIERGLWSPERRAAASERAKGRRKPPFDSDLESVKADFETGMSTGSIAAKWNCSDAHIRNFLMRNGIDPRRTARQDREVEIKSTSVDEDHIGEDVQNTIVSPDMSVEAEIVEDLPSQIEEPTKPNESDQIEIAPMPITVKPYRPDPWDTAELSSDDWPDIQKLLAGGISREAIAGDYDVPIKTLNAFIEWELEAARQRRLAKGPDQGEAHAPLQG